MKNIQIIDEAINATYDIFSVTGDEFNKIFPKEGQNVEFIEDLVSRMGDQEVFELMDPVWKRLQKKSDVVGVHGTLFYGLLEKKKFYPEKKDPPINTRLIL